MSKNDFKIPPPLNPHVVKNVKAYADRIDYLYDQQPINSYLEIGVLAGDYTDMVINTLRPNEIVLVDPFNEIDWNQANNPRFDSDTHYNFIIKKYGKNKNINIIKEYFDPVESELSKSTKQYDYIYLDAKHSYDFMAGAIKFAVEHLSPNGIIGINDYVIFDPFTDQYYGVVQAVNQFLFNNAEWKVHAYVIGATLHSDIYITRNLH
jgi:hypothetical protein